jgi:hypothetical protein
MPFFVVLCFKVELRGVGCLRFDEHVVERITYGDAPTAFDLFTISDSFSRRALPGDYAYFL